MESVPPLCPGREGDGADGENRTRDLPITNWRDLEKLCRESADFDIENKLKQYHDRSPCITSYLDSAPVLCPHCAPGPGAQTPR